MKRNLDRLEETNVVLVDEPMLLEAQSYITACEACAENLVISFDYVLDAVTGCDPRTTEYVMSRLAKCPNCRHELNEKTLVATNSQ